MRRWWLVVLFSCSHDKPPPAVLIPVAPAALCVTKGELTGNAIDAPTFRAFSRESTGDAAALTFLTRGETSTTRELASGQLRRQIGLKLRAQDGCNLVYVMWRLDPKPKVEVSVKWNPGMATHGECGADGYTKVKAQHAEGPPGLEVGSTHTLRAEIHGDELTAWIDDTVAWRGTLPETARSLSGPAGLRSDNLALDVVEFRAALARDAGTCRRDQGD